MDFFSRRGTHNRRRRFPGVKGVRPDQKKFRCETTQERLTYWRGLTPQEQLKELDRRLGKGVGATRQRARLRSLLNKNK